MRHVDEPAAVEVDHGVDVLIGDGLPVAELAEAGGVHEITNVGVEIRETLPDCGDVRLTPEVGHYRNCGGAQQVGDLLQGVMIAGDEP